jgi:hypothetical protein
LRAELQRLKRDTVFFEQRGFGGSFRRKQRAL